MSERVDEPEQIFARAREQQARDHVVQIQRLEARVRELEAELAGLRAGGGTDELRDLPGAALAALLSVFEAVPIPDLSSWERGQCLRKLSASLAAQEGRGELPAGTWTLAGDEPRVQVREGDGATVARVTRQIVQALAEVGGGYLARMVEFQGTTPDHVSRARASHLMDVSSALDAKAQYSVLAEDGRRALFEQHIDQLIHAKDQLATVTRWMNEARDRIREINRRVGAPAPRDASLVGLVAALDDHDGVDHDSSLRATVRQRVAAYAELLPAPEVRRALGAEDTPFRQAFGAGVPEDAELPLLVDALLAVLDDHQTIEAGLRSSALAKRARQALGRLSKRRAGDADAAREALAQVGALLAQVDDVHTRLQHVEKKVVKQFAPALERAARARIAASPHPEAAAAAFERMTKADRTASLAELWAKQLDRIDALLNDPTGGLERLRAEARAAAAEAIGDPDAADLGARGRLLEAVREGLRNPPDAGDELLALAPPIDVEEGLLAQQQKDLARRVADFLSRYSRSRRTGVESLPDAAAKLSAVDALPRGKKAALDELLRKAHRGKLTPKSEAETANALVDEQRELAAARARLEERKATALIHLRPQVESLGFKGIAAYDELAERIARELERVAVAAAAAATLGGHLTELHDLVEALVPDRPASQDEARALLERVREDRNALAGLAGEVEQARQRYLAAVNELLRKPVDGFDVARLTLAEVAQELATLAGLETAADDYVAGAAARAPGLTTLAKIKTWLGREQRKAELLRDALAAADHDVQRAVRSLGALRG